MVTIELKEIENEHGFKLWRFTYSFKCSIRSCEHENALEAMLHSGYVKTVEEAERVFNDLTTHQAPQPPITNHEIK